MCLPLTADPDHCFVLMSRFDLAFFCCCYLHSSQELLSVLLCLSHFKSAAAQPEVTSG